MKHALALILALVTAGCAEPAEQPAANTVEAQAANEVAPAPAAVPSLAGEWAVSQINNKAPDQVWPMSARVSENRFTVVSECREMSWALRQKGNIVQFTPAAGKDCARVRSPAEHVIDKAVQLANIAMFSDEGRTVQLTGPGGSVTMTRR